MDKLTPEKARMLAVAQAMTELTLHPSWDLYREEMEQAELRMTERMVTGNKEEFDYLKGYIEGLRHAYHLPKLLIARAQTT